MLSLTEARDKTQHTGHQVQEMLDSGYYDYDEINLFGTGMGLRGGAPQEPLKQADANALMETLRTVDLSHLMRKLESKEFLAKSGSTGIAGAAYLIPTKVHQVMFDSATQADITPEISIAIIPADQIPGTTHDVAIAVDDQYTPHDYSSGGDMPTETIQYTKATLDFSTPFGINFAITNDLIEDSQFDVIEMHLRNAGRELGEYAAEKAIVDLNAGSDGDGTQNTEAASNDETKMDDIVAAFRANAQDGFVSDRMLLLHEQWLHSIIVGATNLADYATAWHESVISTIDPAQLQVLGMKPIFVTPNSTMDPDSDLTETVSFVFAKDYALLTGRKRWLRIEKYSDPIRDLSGATITCRQDSVTVYKDATCVITEA
jgi:hypothetical protein